MTEYKWSLFVTGYVDHVEFEGTPEDAFNTLMNEVVGFLENSCRASVDTKVRPFDLYKKLKELGVGAQVVVDILGSDANEYEIAITRTN